METWNVSEYDELRHEPCRASRRSTITRGSTCGTTTVTGSARCTATPWRELDGAANFLRPFRGVNKEHLEQYIIMFQWSYNLKAVTGVFLRCLLGCSVATEFVT